MKTKGFLQTIMAIALMAVAPYYVQAQVVEKEESQETVRKGMTVNGRSATPQEKAVASKMVRQAGQMTKKATQMAVSAVTDPSKARQLGSELEEMGNDLERMGDSLEALAEDTTFFYEGEDSDDVYVTAEDWEDFTNKMEETFGENIQFFDTWWGKILGGVIGVMIGILGILIAIFVIALVFGVLTSPLWIVGLIIWLIARGTRSNPTNMPPHANVHGTSSANLGGTASASKAANAGGTTTSQYSTNQGTTFTGTTLYPDENSEMWRSGVMWSCVGVGLIVFFVALGMKALWGIGALVACIGVAKLVIASTTKSNKNNGAPQQESFVTGLGAEDNAQPKSNAGTNAPSSNDYNKNEN